MEQMLSIADQQNIVVEYFDFAPPLEGIYLMEKAMPPAIGLSCSLHDDIPLLRSVMAEELGHHFTTAGMYIPRQFYHYSDRLRLDHCELKALRWAANYLVPDAALRDALRGGIDVVSSLAEHFVVTPELMRFRLKLFEPRL